MNEQTFKAIRPKEFHHRFLEQGIRANGRTPHEFRRVHVAQNTVSTTDGSALVRVGRTAVLCGVTLEVGAPQPSTPTHGWLEVSVQLSAHCGARFVRKRRTGSSQEEARMAVAIQDIIVKSKALLCSDLCIVSGTSVWVLYADVVCLDFDGNVLDAACLAVVAALRTVRFPPHKVLSGGEVVFVPPVPSTPPPVLQLAHIPIAISFGVLDNQLIADPTSDEEAVLSCRVTVAFNERHELCFFLKPGQEPLSSAHLQASLQLAEVGLLLCDDAHGSAVQKRANVVRCMITQSKDKSTR